jgi:hypothetical protein
MGQWTKYNNSKAAGGPDINVKMRERKWIKRIKAPVHWLVLPILCIKHHNCLFNSFSGFVIATQNFCRKSSGRLLEKERRFSGITKTCRSFKSRFLGEKSIKIDEIWSILSILKTANARYMTPNYYVWSPLQEMRKRVNGWRLHSVNLNTSAVASRAERVW